PPRRASGPQTSMARTSLIVSSNARRHVSVSTWLLNRNRALSEGRLRQRRAAQNEQERICRRRGRERHADTGDRPISHVERAGAGKNCRPLENRDSADVAIELDHLRGAERRRAEQGDVKVSGPQARHGPGGAHAELHAADRNKIEGRSRRKGSGARAGDLTGRQGDNRGCYPAREDEGDADSDPSARSHVRAHLCTWMFPSLIRLSGTSSNGTGGGAGGGTIGVCHIVTWIVSLFLPGSPLSVTFTSNAHSVPLQRPFPWNMAELDPNSTSSVTGPFTCRPVAWLT